jgi:DNA segregation ATPase FtsK/SpoIIIE, S-DNA-T family
LGFIANTAAIETLVSDRIRHVFGRRTSILIGGILVLFGGAIALALATWSVQDPSLNHAINRVPDNLLGFPGAVIADLLMQVFGLVSIFLVAFLLFWGFQLVKLQPMPAPGRRAVLGLLALGAGATAVASLPVLGSWPLPTGLGGFLGDFSNQTIGAVFGSSSGLVANLAIFGASAIAFLALASRALDLRFGSLLARSKNVTQDIIDDSYDDDLYEEELYQEDRPERFAWIGAIGHLALSLPARARRLFNRAPAAPTPVVTVEDHYIDREETSGGLVSNLLRWAIDRITNRNSYEHEDEDFIAPVDSAGRIEPVFAGGEPAHAPYADPANEPRDDMFDAEDHAYPEPARMETRSPAESDRVQTATARLKQGKRISREAQPSFLPDKEFVLPPLRLLAKPTKVSVSKAANKESLEQNARMLESVLEDYGISGEIINVRPGPVVTLYELEPAPGIKSARVIGLADDIARSMSAISARIAVIPGRNAIGIELPNSTRETVFFREMVASENFERTKSKLPLVLGKTIGGEPVIADLARMPHLLIAGTTGSGKSVGINAMILSLLYRLPPDKCKLIMIDPKMLELSVYDGIPHLLSPVVTDPKKAVVALKWTVREMEERYKKMSKLGVRNIDGFNQRVEDAREKGEVITRTVQTGFDRETGKAVYETEELELEPMPFIVVIVDEMADLMMVAGKDIEGTIQRLAQMARAAGIHMITATQRPSVDVITGTIKANFPTRISFQVTSKIDSRTILGEQGAEQLLGQGDMLHMAGGGRISRVHGAFVSDDEVERVVSHLKKQGVPEYLDVTVETEEAEIDAGTGLPVNGDGDDLYNRAVNIVIHDRKASTSYIQRRLSIGYNRAATIIEQMEAEGVIGPANHAGKREILVGEDA